MESTVSPTMNELPPVVFTEPIATPAWMRWTGRAISAVIFLLMGPLGLAMLLISPDEMQKGMAQQGFPLNTVAPIVVAEVVAAVLYVIPRTATLGAFLIVGYLGGAVATHVRAGDGLWPIPVAFGLVAGLGLWLRDPRVRALVPWRRG